MVEFKMKSEYLCEVILWGVILLYWNPIVGYILHLWNLIFFLSVTTIPYGMVVNKKYQKYLLLENDIYIYISECIKHHPLLFAFD